MEMDKRRAELIDAALELFVERGLIKTSIAGITERVGVARSLFYHYFADKKAIVDAVIDDRVDDFMMRLEQWARSRDINDMREVLRAVVVVIRSFLLGEDSFGRYILTENNAFLRQQFTVRCSKRISEKSSSMLLTLYDPSSGREPMKHVRETMYVLCIGVMSLLFQNPDVSDEALLEIIANVLGIDI